MIVAAAIDYQSIEDEARVLLMESNSPTNPVLAPRIAAGQHLT
jgi:hypothetical protein